MLARSTQAISTEAERDSGGEEDVSAGTGGEKRNIMSSLLAGGWIVIACILEMKWAVYEKHKLQLHLH